MEILKPYRSRINVIDEQIIELLRRRYDIIDEVGHIKAKNNIASTLPDRVKEVEDRAGELAAKKGLDENFIRHIYAQIIDHSCAQEQFIIENSPRKKAS